MKRVKNYLFLKEDVLGRGTAGIVYKGTIHIIKASMR